MILNYSHCEISTKENSVFNFNICKSVEKIGQHIISDKKCKKKYTAEFIIEIEDSFISCGTNNKFNVYNYFYENTSSKESEDWIYNIALTSKGNNIIVKDNNKIFLASSKKAINYYYYYKKNFGSLGWVNKIPFENNLLYLLYMEGSIYLLCCENNVYICSNLFDILNQSIHFLIYENVLIKSAIKINNDLVVLKSNKIVSKGMSKLLIFNSRMKTIFPLDLIKNDEEYSFIYSALGQALITYFDEKKFSLLLFACKKYNKNQKNGILLLYNLNNIKEKEFDKEIKKIEVNSYFHNTDNFEPYCICPLKIYLVKSLFNALFEEKETPYFLVGGFEKKIRQGMIKS